MPGEPCAFVQRGVAFVSSRFRRTCAEAIRRRLDVRPRRLYHGNAQPCRMTLNGLKAIGWLQQQRFLATASSNKSEDPLELFSYLEEKAKIDSSLHQGMLKALQSVYGKNVTKANLESFGMDGLRALAASVEQQQMKHNQAPRPSRKVTFDIPHHRTSFELDWYKGDSLLDVAKNNEELLGEYMEGTCGGQMSCCTCHVYLDDATLKRLPKASRAENDMLDLAFEPRENSRLGCQVELRRSILNMEEPVVVTLPSNVHNVWK